MNNDVKKSIQAKDKATQLLSNLEEVKAKGKISEAQYANLKSDYQKMYDTAVSEIDAVNQELQKKDNENKRELEKLKEDLDNLQARHTVGELSESIFKKQEKSLKRKIDQLSGTSVQEIQGILKVKPSFKNYHFKNHLNMTMVYSWIIGFLMSLLGRMLFPDTNVLGYVALIGILCVNGWACDKKGRSPVWALIFGVPFGFIVLLLLSNKKPPAEIFDAWKCFKQSDGEIKEETAFELYRVLVKHAELCFSERFTTASQCVKKLNINLNAASQYAWDEAVGKIAPTNSYNDLPDEVKQAISLMLPITKLKA